MAIPHIVLYDQNRTDASLFRADYRSEICKINISALNIQTIPLSILKISYPIRALKPVFPVPYRYHFQYEKIISHNNFVSFMISYYVTWQVRCALNPHGIVISSITHKWNDYTSLSLTLL